MKKFTRLAVLTAFTFLLCFQMNGWGQLSITTTGTAFTQNFDAIGSSGTASLPSGVTVSQGTVASAGTSATTLAYGTSGTGAVTGSSGGGTINWANGITASSTDRALGFLTSGSFTSPRNVFYQITNNTGTVISSLTVNFDIEKYRTGTRAWNINFYSGADGSNWTAQTSGDQAYPADAANAVVNPPTTTSKSVTINGLSIAAGTSYYLRWAYTGTGGSTNSQGLGFDNISITATGSTGSSAPTLTADPYATVDGSFYITFTDNSTWRSAITGITVGGATLPSSAYSTLSAGQISFVPSQSTLLQSTGAKSIVISANGFDNALISQTINPGAPNSNSTTSINLSLTTGVTRTITCTAKDQYNNLVSGYTFKYDALITNIDPTNNESYTIDGSAYSSSSNDINVVATTNASGVATFTVAIPVIVDGNDGVSIQVQLSNGSTNVGSAFSFLKIPPQITLTGIDPGTSNLLQGSSANILYRIKVDVLNDASTLSQLLAITNGTYIAADIPASGFKLRYSADANLDVVGTDPVIGSISSSSTGTGEVLTFTGMSQSFAVGTAYIFLTVDISATGVAGHSVSGEATANSDFTFGGSATFSGSTFILASLHNILLTPQPGEIVINQMSPDYNGASDEYIELLNKTNKTFDLSLLKIEYQSANGSSGSSGGVLSGTLEPFQYWLLSPNPSITAGLTTSLSRDGAINAGFAAAAGQIALRLKNAPNTIIDGLAYGSVSTNNLGEGTAAGSPPADGGLIRTVDGLDDGTNNTDFTSVTNANIYLRNHNSINVSADYTLPTTTYPADVWISNSASVALSGNTTISGKLTILSGILTVSPTQSLTVNGVLTNSAGISGLILESNALGTGSLIENSGASATVQRHIDGWGTLANHGWHLLSSPVAAQAIQQGFVSDPPSLNEDFYSWSEGTNEWINSKDESGVWNSSFDNSFTVGKGYLVAYLTSGARDFSGVLNSTNVSISGLTNSSGTNHGWNLLGNPFPSALKWNDGNWNLTNVSASAKIWKEADASYVDITAGQVIPAMNGFMVKTSGSGTLTIPAASREHNSTPWYKNSEGKIVLTARDLENITAQQSVIMINEQATENFDENFDSPFLAGFAPLFYSIQNGEQLSSNVLPDLGDSRTIQMGFEKNEASSFSIELNAENRIPNLKVYLTDKKTGIITDLTSNSSYNFTSNDGDDPNRFTLHFKDATSVADPATSIDFTAYAHNGQLNILSSVSGKLSITDMAGKTLSIRNITNGELNTVSLNGVTGLYLVKLSTTQGNYIQKVVVK